MLQDEQELAGSRRKEERGREEEKGEGENCEQIHTSDKNKGLFINDVIILRRRRRRGTEEVTTVPMVTVTRIQDERLDEIVCYLIF